MWSLTLTHTHTHTHAQSVGLPWTSDRPVTKASTWQHPTATRLCAWRDFFCSVFVLHPYLFFVWIVLHFAFCRYCTTRTQIFMPPAGFEPAIPASSRPQTLAIDRASTGVGLSLSVISKMTYRFGTDSKWHRRISCCVKFCITSSVNFKVLILLILHTDCF
jgi:hypothetical protein